MNGDTRNTTFFKQWAALLGRAQDLMRSPEKLAPSLPVNSSGGQFIVFEQPAFGDWRCWMAAREFASRRFLARRVTWTESDRETACQALKSQPESSDLPGEILRLNIQDGSLSEGQFHKLVHAASQFSIRPAPTPEDEGGSVLDGTTTFILLRVDGKRSSFEWSDPIPDEWFRLELWKEEVRLLINAVVDCSTGD